MVLLKLYRACLVREPRQYVQVGILEYLMHYAQESYIIPVAIFSLEVSSVIPVLVKLKPWVYSHSDAIFKMQHFT